MASLVAVPKAALQAVLGLIARGDSVIREDLHLKVVEEVFPVESGEPVGFAVTIDAHYKRTIPTKGRSPARLAPIYQCTPANVCQEVPNV